MLPISRIALPTVASVIAIAAVIGAAPASADVRNVSITKVTTPFDNVLTIKMKDSGSGYVLDEAIGASLKVRLRAETTGGSNIRIDSAIGALQNRNFYTLPLNYSPKQLDETVSVNVTAADLQPHVASAAERCADVGKRGSTTKLGFAFNLSFQAASYLSNSGRDTTTYLGGIVCGPKSKGPADVAQPEGQFKVNGITLALAPSASASSHPSKGLSCKQGELTVRVATTKAGALSFRLHTKVGNQPVEEKPILTWSKHVGPGKFEAVYKTSIKVTKNAEVQAMAEDLVNPIGLSTGWKLAKVFCSSTGVGDLADKPDNSNPDGLPKHPVPPKRLIKGGADKLTGASHPTHSPADGQRPTKTAPAPKTPVKAIVIRLPASDRRG